MPRPPRLHPARTEGGFTAIELAVAMAVMLLCMGLTVPVLISGFRAVKQQSSGVEANDQAQLAFAQVQRDVRSGNVIAAPGPLNGLAGMEVRIYTQSFGAPICVQYRVSGGRLERRTRAPGAAVPWPSAWATVVEGIANESQNPVVTPFTRSSDRQVLTVDLLVTRAERPAALARVTSSVTGRNTKYYATPFAEETCD